MLTVATLLLVQSPVMITVGIGRPTSRVAGWILVFGREEFADHGRPYGGREGGEFDVQPPQPGRPDYTAGDDDGQHGDLEVKDG